MFVRDDRTGGTGRYHCRPKCSAAMGHEDAGCRFRKETIAGMRRRGPTLKCTYAGHELVELQVVKELAVPLQRPLLIDCLHALEGVVYLAGYSICHRPCPVEACGARMPEVSSSAM